MGKTWNLKLVDDMLLVTDDNNRVKPAKGRRLNHNITHTGWDFICERFSLDIFVQNIA